MAARGYLLLEVAIGGAMVAVICATIMFSLAGARVNAIVAGRDAIAGDLAMAKVEEARAIGSTLPSATCAVAPGTPTTTAVGGAVYTVTCVTGATQTQTFPGITPATLSFRQLDVTVTYQSKLGTGFATRTVTSSSRVYQ